MKKMMLSSSILAALAFSGYALAQQMVPSPTATTQGFPAPVVPVQQPVAQPMMQQPVAQQPMVQQPMAQQPMVQQPMVQQPVKQQPVQQVPVQYQQVPVQQIPVAAPTVQSPPSQPPASLPPLPSDFQVGAQQNLGMSPGEIRELRGMLDARQKAASEWPNPPKSVTGSISVSLDPGSVPSVIRPFYGVSTSLVILDSTGAPWPVENFNIGNKGLFEVERLDGVMGSSFIIAPLQAYGQSNLILKLAGHPTPVVINLVGGQKVHDARVEARVLGVGPNARVTSMSLTPGVDSRLLSVLDGVPPSGRALKVNGDSASRAWAMPDGRIWLRTGLNVISPAPISFVSSSDGTRVYKLAPTAKVLGMLQDQFVTLEISGCLQECASGEAASEW